MIPALQHNKPYTDVVTDNDNSRPELTYSSDDAWTWPPGDETKNDPENASCPAGSYLWRQGTSILCTKSAPSLDSQKCEPTISTFIGKPYGKDSGGDGWVHTNIFSDDYCPAGKSWFVDGAGTIICRTKKCLS